LAESQENAKGGGFSMILLRRQDVFHKIQLLRLLAAILDDQFLAQNLYFKGGSAASMLGWLDRFSLDLDFDLNALADKDQIKERLFRLFATLDLELKNRRVKNLQFILRYQAEEKARNQLKLSLAETLKTNDYQPFYLAEIARYAICQTKETMVANKLVAPLDRFERYRTIAGRDFYDLHYFFLHGFSYKKEVIEERRGVPVQKYLRELLGFIQEKLTQRVLDEDLNYLLPDEKFQVVRKVLKMELVNFLGDEIKRLPNFI